MGRENVDKVLEVFYEFPAKKFTVRELSKLTKVPRATVHKVLVGLKKEGMVDGEGRAETNLLFSTKKVNYFVEKIVRSGLIDFLAEELNPSVIILFGSLRKGDSVKESDIDIFVESFSKKRGFEGQEGFDLEKFEKKIGHEIQLFVHESIMDVNKNLRSNIINGIKLYGYLKTK